MPAEWVTYSRELDNGYVTQDFALEAQLGNQRLTLMLVSDCLDGRFWSISSRWVPTRVAGRSYEGHGAALRAAEQAWRGYRAWVGGLE